MPRQAATAVENNFNKGLITEATGLNFPENACSETWNCDFKLTGEVSRRLGFDPESGYVENSITGTLEAIQEYVWYDVANIGNLTFLVQQIDDTLHFFEVGAGAAISAQKKSGTIDIGTYRTAEGSAVCEFTDGDGRLFVAHPWCNPFYIDFDPDLDTFTATEINLEVRDFERVEDNLEIDERPSTLTDLHEYNLRNQGWDADADNDGGSGNVLDYWEDERSDYPSNADVWWLFKNIDEEIDEDQFDKVWRGNTPATGGHFIYPAFEIDRDTKTGLSGLPSESAGNARPSSVTFHSGRLFYAGVQAAGYGDRVYFTPVLEYDGQLGQCYQQNDPTSEDNSDLLPSDGGVIVIKGVGRVVKIYSLGYALFVISTNGVWVITGSEGVSFAANDYAVLRLSEHGTHSNMPFAEAEGQLYFCNTQGIYGISPAQGGGFQVGSITNETIKTFFEEIPKNNVPYIKAAYNPVEQIVQFLVRLADATTPQENFRYDTIINFRLSTEAFWPWSITHVTDGPFVSGLFCAKGGGSYTTTETVVDEDGEIVTVG